MSPEPFVSHAKALPAKKSGKDYGDENDTCFEKYITVRAKLVPVPNRALEFKIP